MVGRKLLGTLLLAVGMAGSLFGKNTIVNVDRYEWIVQTSPSMNSYLRTYFKDFQENDFDVFVDLDFIETYYDESEELPPYQFETKDGLINGKLLQGHIGIGGAPFFIIWSGIEVSKMSTDANYDTKEFAIGSYQEFWHFNVLGSLVVKTQPEFETVDGRKYFTTKQDATDTTFSANLMGNFDFFESGVFYDSEKGLEKFYASLKQDTPIGDFELRATGGYLPYDYQDLFFEYKLEKIYFDYRDYLIRFATNYRKLGKNDSSDKETGDFVNSEVELRKNFGNGVFNMGISYSYNKEFTPKPLHGYKFHFDVGEFFFVSISKNYSQDLQRLPLEDATLFGIGLSRKF